MKLSNPSTRASLLAGLVLFGFTHLASAQLLSTGNNRTGGKGLTFSTSVFPRQSCFNDDVPRMTTNWDDSVTIPRFDPALGILTSVDFELTGGIFGSARIESLDAAPSVVTTDYQAEITLQRPNMSTLVVAVPLQNFADNLTAFDGTIDFGGTSGMTYPDIAVSDMESASSMAPADLGLFTGPIGNPGTITLPVLARGMSLATGSGNLITQFMTEAEAMVRVCYNYELDCNNNRIADDLDIANGTSQDCNSNGIPDECEPDCDNDGIPDDCEEDCDANGTPDDCQQFPDCNGNNVPDVCDIADGTSTDLNSNGTPDECETDCNNNNVPDDVDIANGTSQDCNSNRIPDECEPDCDNDGIPDDCETDCDANGTPDDCQQFPDCNGNNVPDVCDITNGTSTDLNSNGIPDECEPDCNNNNVPDDVDIANGTSQDCNSNGIPDECEPDCDNDGIPDDCETDCDANGTPDDCQQFPDCNGNNVPDVCDIADGTSTDLNSNGIPDECEADCNNNNVPDDVDIANGTSQDCNSNGIPDECEPDCDNDGIPDDCEEDCDANGTPDDCQQFPDCNGNNVPDVCDIADGTSTDLNSNGIPDECETDCNNNNVPDDVDIANGTSQDCNSNGIPDECEPDCDNDGIPDDCEEDCDANGTPDDCQQFEDCNGNDVPDVCDIADGTSTDLNSNGIPDECETDCNNNNVPDDVDIANGTSQDCNSNGIPDECEPDCDNDGIPDDCETDCDANGTPDDCQQFEDCNGNNVPDVCDISLGNSEDCNSNGIPDECEEDCDSDGIPDDCEDDTDGDGTPDDCEECPAPASFCEVGCYNLTDVDGPVLPPFSLKLEGLFGDAPNVYTFSFEEPGTGVQLCYDGAGNITINGIAYGGLDIGDEWDPVVQGFLSIDMTYTGAVCDGDSLVVPVSGNGFGVFNWMNDDLDIPVSVEANNFGELLIMNGATGVLAGWIVLPGSSEGIQDFRSVLNPASDCFPQPDCDGDGVPDFQEEDCNANSIPDDCEQFMDDCNSNGIPDECDVLSGDSDDLNGNGVPDECEEDCNNNGIPDDFDISSGTSMDCNANGIPDECEPDCDNDGVPDDCEADCNQNGTVDDCESFMDCNGNNVPDECDISNGGSSDVNDNGTPDECEPDCNGNGVPDDFDISSGSSMDCNSNGTPDECESDCDGNGVPDDCEDDCNQNGQADVCEQFEDCNNNSVPDVCDISSGDSADLNSNGIPDECEPDCNNNGVPDDVDIANGTSADCNQNGRPDECEPDCDSNGTPDACEVDCNQNGTPDACEQFEDCNGNNVPDICDILAGDSSDMNMNGVPDECECVAPANACDDGCYELFNSPTPALGPPSYGLRMAGLFDDGPDAWYTFDFEYPGASMSLCYDSTAGTVSIEGRAYGGLDIGGGYDPVVQSYVDIRMTYYGVECVDDVLVAPKNGTGLGQITWLETGQTAEISPKPNNDDIYGNWATDGGMFPVWHGWLLTTTFTSGKYTGYIGDFESYAVGTSDCPEAPDCDGDGIPDSSESDMDGDGVPDDCDFICATNLDSDGSDPCLAQDIFRSFWFSGIEDGVSQRYYRWTTTGELRMFADGRALLTGRIENLDDSNRAFFVTYNYDVRNQPGDGNYPPSDSPKLQTAVAGEGCYDFDGGPAVVGQWVYFEELDGILSGLGTYAGALISVDRSGPSFQVGDAANLMNGNYGASGWFDYEILAQPSGSAHLQGDHGDVNTDLSDCVGNTSTVGMLWSFEENSGSVAYDSLGDHDGAYLGSIGHGSNGVAGMALKLNGDNACVEIPHDDAFLLDEGTIEMWIQPRDEVDSQQGLFSKDSSGYDDGGHLTIYLQSNGKVKVRLQSDDESHTVDSDDEVLEDEWTHVRFTFGPEGMKLYINGELNDTDSYSGGLGSSSGSTGNREPIVIGANSWSSDDESAWPLKEYFEGYMDEVRIYPVQF